MANRLTSKTVAQDEDKSMMALRKNLILRRARSARLEGWPEPLAMVRDGSPKARLRASLARYGDAPHHEGF